MIVYGSRGIKSKGDPGSFYCPVCRIDSGYEWYKVRRWFTLYFIPLIPLKVAGEYVECSACRGTFETTSVGLGPDHYEAESRQFEAEFQKAMKGIMLLTLLADGRVEPAELEAVRDIYSRLTGAPYAPDALAADAHRFAADSVRIEDYLGDAGSRLNDGGKAMVYQAAWLVAQADGELASQERAVLKRIRRALGMSRAAVRDIESLRT